MRILAFSCHNIGPFHDRTLSVIFRHGRFLIKAPIGSGKSFLFFDGPVFALYKSSSRTILSTQADEGWVKILVEHEGKRIICSRSLTRTKAGNDAVKSAIWVNDDTNARLPRDASTPIVNTGRDVIADVLMQPGRESIPCKNETDAQGILEPFLPPEDVFLTTMFLLQDSKNIFDLVPAERIRLLKEIFGLISIDAATEKIQDEKKAVSAIIKSKEYSGDMDGKFQGYLQTLTQQLRALGDTRDSTIALCLDALSYAQDNATLGGFTLELSRHDALVAYHETLALDTERITHELAQITAQEQRTTELTSTLARITQSITQCDTQIAQVDSARIEQAHIAYTTAQQTYDAHLAHEADARTSLDTAVWTDAHAAVGDLATLITYCDTLIQQGKDAKIEIETTTREIEHLRTRTQQLDDDIARDHAALHTLTTDYKKKLEFFCEKISDNCPFIEKINGSLFAGLQKNLTDLQTTIDAKQSKKQQEGDPTRIAALEARIETLTAQQSSLRNAPSIIHYKAILAAKQAYQDRYATKTTLEKNLRTAQQARDVLQAQSIRKAEREGQRDALYKQRDELNAQIALASTQDTASHRTNISTQLTASKERVTTLNAALLTYQRIHDLTAQHTDAQRAIKSLREREVILTDLNRIFGKEIMIKVLEDSLPHFAEYINNILAKMVSFEIIFSPRKITGDKLELEIIIRDEHGERNAKSLSGGQKAILKLAWTLGVAHMSHSEQLFLDETINNIDRATIHHVTAMLEDYFTMHDIPLYIVTHSQQLQEMGLWDEIIMLDDLAAANTDSAAI